MTRKRFKIFMIIFIIISISVLSGFMINNFQNRKKSGSGDEQNKVQTEGVSGNFKDNGQSEETGFTFYMNESAVKKTKTTSNEVTTFNLELKLFITNKNKKNKK